MKNLTFARIYYTSSISEQELEEDAVPNPDTSAKLSVATSRKVRYSPADMQYRSVSTLACKWKTDTGYDYASERDYEKGSIQRRR